MFEKRDKALIRYDSFDKGDILRLSYYRELPPGSLYNIEIIEGVYEVVGMRSIRSGCFGSSRRTFYAIDRLDHSGEGIIIYELEEINERLVAKVFPRVLRPLKSFVFDIQINIIGHKTEDSALVDTYLYHPSYEEFVLICEEIHTEAHSLIGKRNHEYHSPTNRKFFDIVEDWQRNNDAFHHKFRSYSWEYSKETKSRIEELIGIETA